MNRLLRALAVVLLFEMGALLLYLPWSTFWEQNYFFRHVPGLMPVSACIHRFAASSAGSAFWIFFWHLDFSIHETRLPVPLLPPIRRFSRLLCYVTDRRQFPSDSALKWTATRENPTSCQCGSGLDSNPRKGPLWIRTK